jgi:hypothetical protein
VSEAAAAATSSAPRYVALDVFGERPCFSPHSLCFQAASFMTYFFFRA